MHKTCMVAALFILGGLALAARGQEDVKLTGYLIDNACGTKNASDAAKIQAHTKVCALMPPCVKSGYAVYADGKLYKLDKAGNAKAEALLKSTKTEKGVQVKIEGQIVDNEFRVKSISETT